MKATSALLAIAIAGLVSPGTTVHAVSPPGKAFVVNQADSTVSLVDLYSMKELQVINVGYNPYFVSISGDQKTLAVAIEGEGKIKFYDTKTLRQKGECLVGTMTSEHMLELPDGKRFMFAHRTGNEILIISYETMKIERRIENVSAPHNLQLGATNRYVYASSKANTGVSVIDLEQGKVLRIVPMKFMPRGLGSSPDDRYFYTGANWVCGVWVYETQTGKLARFIQTPFPGGKLAVEENTYHGITSVNDSVILASCEGMNALDVINVRSGQLIARTENVSMPGALLPWPGRPGWYIFTNMKSSTVQTLHLGPGYTLELGPTVKCGTGRIEFPKRFAFFWG